MAVTKQTYTAAATWTAAQLADTFRSAFIDAGLMTDWFDSFTNTVENRILRVIYDGTKANGTVFYWFMFTTAGPYIQTALGWNATSHVPTGTQYLDYYSTTTNSVGNHRQIVALTAATGVTLTRYTSGINTGATWFLLRNGSTNQAFSIPTPTYGPSSFVDQDKLAYALMLFTTSETLTAGSSLLFYAGCPQLWKTIFGASGLRSSTGSNLWLLYLSRFIGSGNVTYPIGNFIPNNTAYTGIFLPTAHSNTNTSLASNHTPVFTSPPVNPYQAALPADFGIVSYHASNVMAVQDTFVVNAGVEEWDIIALCSNASYTDAAKVMFLARTVG